MLALITALPFAGPPTMPRPGARGPPMTPFPARALRLAEGRLRARRTSEDCRPAAADARVAVATAGFKTLACVPSSGPALRCGMGPAPWSAAACCPFRAEEFRAFEP